MRTPAFGSFRGVSCDAKAPLVDLSYASKASCCKACSHEIITWPLGWAVHVDCMNLPSPNPHSKPQPTRLQFICLAILYGLKEIKDPPDARVAGEAFEIWNHLCDFDARRLPWSSPSSWHPWPSSARCSGRETSGGTPKPDEPEHLHCCRDLCKCARLVKLKGQCDGDARTRLQCYKRGVGRRRSKGVKTWNRCSGQVAMRDR